MFYLLYYITFPFIWLTSLLPLNILYFFANGFYVLIYYVFGYRKKIVIQNLKNSFPEKSEEEIHIISKRFYHHFCNLFFEIIKQISISSKEFKNRVKYKNPEILHDLYAKGKSCMIVTAHYGNWEWPAALTDLTKYKSMSVYKPLTNKPLENMLSRMRTRFGAEVVPMNQAIRTIIKYRNANLPTMAYFIADQTPMFHHTQYWTKFLNQETPVYLGVEKIARQFNMAVLYYKMVKIGKGKYEIEIIKLFEETANLPEFEITEAHVRVLEQTIIEKPEYWLWTHRRWKWSHLVDEHKQTMRNSFHSNQN
jgi:KDO2-lipid IV(A) lauroyltransferase